MKFNVIYSPTDLKNHEGQLKISNKFEEHIYNFKGKSIPSKKIEMLFNFNVP